MKKILLLSIFVIICSINLLYAQTNLVNRSYSPDTTGGYSNSVFGLQAGLNNTGNWVSIFGYQAGLDNAGQYNSFFGHQAGYKNTTGRDNIFIGFSAGASNTTGKFNTFVGGSAGRYSPEGSYNVFFGGNAGNQSYGDQNTFIGFRAGNYNANGSNNIYVGNYAGYNVFHGESNTALGHSAGYNGAMNIENNVFLGSKAGYNADGNANVFLGYQAGYSELGSNKLYIQNDSTSIPLIYGDFATNQVGIDTKSVPSGYSFAVAGKIAVEEVLIDVQTNWPDYVFTQNYDLPTIKEVEIFIANNGHLKDIPSAKEVQEHGILQGEMDAKLLKKIEEITLYVIELNNTNMELKEANAVLNERIQRLEKTINSLTKNE